MYEQLRLCGKTQYSETLLVPASLPTVSESDRGGKTEFLARSATGAVPAGTRSILVQPAFVNSSSEAGYAEHLSLTLDTPVTAPTLVPPASSVPGYSHVFMIMMENTDCDEVLDNPSDTPYVHTLMSEGATMANYHCVYHPSDENYLAVAGADTYWAAGSSGTGRPIRCARPRGAPDFPRAAPPHPAAAPSSWPSAAPACCSSAST